MFENNRIDVSYLIFAAVFSRITRGLNKLTCHPTSKTYDKDHYGNVGYSVRNSMGQGCCDQRPIQTLVEQGVLLN